MGARLAKILVLGAVTLAVTASSGTAASPARAPILGVVPHVNALHAFGALSTLGASGPLVLQTQPCALTSSPLPCWTMRTTKVYAIYWVPSGYAVDANYETLINRYFTDVAAASGSLTNAYSVTTQYYDNAAAVHYQSTFAGSYVDTHAFPTNDCTATPVCLTDVQIQDEIQNVLTTKGWQGGPNTMFFLMTPNGVGSCSDGTSTECTTNAFCAYHSGFDDAAGDPVIYANEPYAATISACSSGSSPNGDDADATINTISHEHNEAITDPWGDAWISNDANGDEIADLCAWNFGSPLGNVGGQQYNQVINGHKYWLQMEYSNDGSTCLQHYAPTVAPTTVAPPVVSGNAGQSQLLSTSEGSWQHAPSGYAYKWQRCAANGTGCADISGATAATYRLTASDVGHTFRGEVSAHNVAGTSAGYVASTVTSVVEPLPSATEAPVLSGVAAVHETLSTTTGTWNTGVVYAYQWLRCAANGTGCTTIPRATSATYVAVAADGGNTLEARVSATNAAGTTVALSNRSGSVVAVPAARKAPHISGRARVGRRLLTGLGSWSGPPTAYRYQWLRCNGRGKSCVHISHATHSTYRVAKHDGRHRLRVRVTAVDIAGTGTAISAATARVAAKH